MEERAPKGGSRRSQLNSLSLRAALLAALVAVAGVGMAVGEVIVIDPNSDTTPPQLVGLSFAPTSIDTNDGAKVVTVVARITDDLSGLASYGDIGFRALSTSQPANLRYVGCRFSRFAAVYSSNVAGQPTDADVEFTCSFGQYVQQGEWVLSYTNLYDRVGNYRYTYEAELAALGVPRLSVTAPAGVSPQISRIAVSPATIDVSAGSINVEAEIDVLTASQFDWAQVQLSSTPYESEYRGDTSTRTVRDSAYCSFSPSQLVAVDEQGGRTYRTTCRFPRYSVAGPWTVTSAYVVDVGGPYTSYYASDGYSGLPTRCTQVSCTFEAGAPPTTPEPLAVTSSPDDREPPVLTAFRFLSRSVDTSLSDANLGLEGAAEDERSGFQGGCVTLVSPNGQQRRGACFWVGQPLGSIVFPRWSEAGDWNVEDLWIWDNNQHTRNYVYYGDDLTPLGFPTAIQVTVGLEVFQATGALGGTADLTARLTSGGQPAAGRTIEFSLQGAPVGSAESGLDGLAVLPGVSLAGIAAGTYRNAVSASFAGDAEVAAVSGSANLTVTVEKVAQVLTFDPLGNRKLAQSPFTVSATATSGLPVQFSTTGACTASGDEVTLTSVGTCNVTASQPGNAEYAAAVSVTRSFQVLAADYALTVSFAGTATGAVTAQADGAAVVLSCSPTACTGAVPAGAAVVLSETPGTGAVFKGWGIVCTGTATTCSFAMNAAKTVKARFEPATFALAVATSGGGVGSVSSAPAGIACGAGATACSASFPNGAGVALTAAFDPATSVFKGWSGVGCSGTSQTCTVAMDGAKSVTATFEPATYPLTVALLGAGRGSVTGGIACSTDTAPCSAPQANGANVVLTAEQGDASVFKGWSGCTAVSGATCTVSMTAAKRVAATFEPATYLLTVARAGTGSGAVAGTANGAAFAWDACGTTQCTKTVANGASVVLTETPGDGAIFGGWGIVCTGTGTTCSFRMNGAKTVKATFAPATYALTVALAGEAAGSVSSAPAGIACGAGSAACSASFQNGTGVVLTASFDATQVLFKGWSGSACSGASTSCTLAMTSTRSVTATFAPATYPLTVAVSGAGRGTVTGPGISCATGSATGCGAQEANGATVALGAAAADAGSVFVGWSGCSSVSGDTCHVAMTSAQSVAAVFEPATYPLTLAWSGIGTGTVTGVTWTACDAAGCSATVANGANVALTAEADAGFAFAGWGVVCTGTGTCAFKMNAAKRVVATFSAP